MVSDFKKRLTAASDRLLAESWRHAEMELHRKKYTRQNTKIAEAMKSEKDGKRMQKCCNGSGEACGSIFCDNCLDKRQRNLYATYKKHVEEDFNNNDKIARRRLRWLTVLHSIVPVNIGTDKDEKVTIAACMDAADELKDNLKKVSRTIRGLYGPRIWLRGAIHAELIDYSLFQFSMKKTVKEKTIGAFIDKNSVNWKLNQWNGKGKRLCFLIHFHALVDREDFKDDELRDLFVDRWNITDRQVHLTPLWTFIETKTGKKKHLLDDALKGTSRYCYSRSNAHLNFARNWGAGEVVLTTGEKVNAKGIAVTYAEEMYDREMDKDVNLSIGEIRLLIKVHNAISGKDHKGLNVTIR